MDGCGRFWSGCQLQVRMLRPGKLVGAWEAFGSFCGPACTAALAEVSEALLTPSLAGSISHPLPADGGSKTRALDWKALQGSGLWCEDCYGDWTIREYHESGEPRSCWGSLGPPKGTVDRTSSPCPPVSPTWMHDWGAIHLTEHCLTCFLHGIAPPHTHELAMAAIPASCTSNRTTRPHRHPLVHRSIA